jgi:predicted dehydrogenase
VILVVGGGFGLYGHVAALATDGADVATLSRYRSIAEQRPELAQLVDRIRWVDDIGTAAAAADMVVLARNPVENALLARKLAHAGTGGLLVIEKPLAATPGEARVLEEYLAARGRAWATPYILLDCDWSAALRSRLAAGAVATLRWSHQQSPRVRAWKADAGQGGGALAFYFIHCVALAEAMMPGATLRRERRLEGDVEHLGLIAAGPRSTLDMHFTLGLPPAFSLTIDDETVISAPTPFGPMPKPGEADPRIPMLRRFYRSIEHQADPQPRAFHAAITGLWSEMADDAAGA